MSFCALLLLVKMVITFVLIALPLIFAPHAILEKLWRQPAPELLFRLYGIALMALIVGYGLAYVAHNRGDDVSWVFPIAIVSNGGAALAIAWLTRGMVRALGGGFFGIMALGFAAAWAWPASLMQPLW
ncbi:MAG: hypothetical protein AAF429_13655 [Pseudomonadota bacterium]